MISADLEAGTLKSGKGKIYKFSPELFLQAVKFIAKKFDLSFGQAKSQTEYYLMCSDLVIKKGKAAHLFSGDKKTTNIRLKNIINFDYEWEELF